jgi:ATP-dependent Clp protease ATP-binding subunit ClpX
MENQISQSAVNPAPQKKQIDKAREALTNLRSIVDWSPKELFQHMEHMEYVGQVEARRRLCLMAYRHIRRLKDHYLKNIPIDKLPPKSNVLMVGPTGCGKSYLAELLFGKILQIPVATVDMTGFVETGYVGRYVSEILFDLLNAAQENPYWAKMGICVLDEFDKVNGKGSNIRFGGAGTTKDVSGYGVQRGLLKLIEGGLHEVSSQGSWGHQAEKTMETDCISFVACGAFTGISELAVSERGSDFGFKPSRKHTRTQGIAYELSQDDISSVEVFSKYGFLPELIGRFNSITHLHPLGKNELMEILKKNVLPKYKKEFEREGQKLSVPKKVMEQIVTKAIKRKTGARGISLLLTEYFEYKAFELFGQNNNDNSDMPF